jgi:hypothetical protein
MDEAQALLDMIDTNHDQVYTHSHTCAHTVTLVAVLQVVSLEEFETALAAWLANSEPPKRRLADGCDPDTKRKRTHSYLCDFFLQLR